MMKIHKGIEQGTPEWHALRAGKLTASCIEKILTPATLEPSKQAYGYAAQLAAERISGKCIDGIKTSAMQKGNDLEPIAKQIYHEQFHQIEEITFMENEGLSFPYGASPDAILVGVNGGVEIKSLSAPKEYFDLMRTGEIAPARKLQMAGQILAGDLDFVDFVIYIEGLKMQPVRYYRDEELIKKIIIAGEVFEEMIKELMLLHNNSKGFLTPVFEEVYDEYE